MLRRTRRRRVVEEEVIEIVSDDSIEVWIKQKERKERERMKYEWNRLDSFDSSWLDKYKLDVSVAQRLAKTGFYAWSGNTKCFWCGLCKSSYFWEEGHDPETVHREESPDCKFITGQSDNVPIEERRMKYERNRLNSFCSWWLTYYQLDIAPRLAKAGFYRWGKGYTDYTACFSCRLYKPCYFWEEGHDPETVHRGESPDCEFITGQSDNVPIERRMMSEQNRLDSFTYKLDVSVTQRLAKAGFCCTYTGDTKWFFMRTV